GLVGDLGNDGRLILAEPGDFVDLPYIVRVIVLLGRRANDHAKKRLAPVPIDGGVADGDGIRALKAAAHAIACRLRQVLERAVGVADPQVAAARDALHIGALVAKDRADG